MKVRFFETWKTKCVYHLCWLTPQFPFDKSYFHCSLSWDQLQIATDTTKGTMGWKLMPAVQPSENSCLWAALAAASAAGHTRETLHCSGIISKRILHLIRAQLLQLHAEQQRALLVMKCYHQCNSAPRPTCSGHKEAIMVINNCIAAVTSG